MLRPVLLAALLTAAAPPAQADGLELPEGLRDGIEGMMEDMLRDLGPALQQGLRALEELDAYAPPEMLPNGDIIIRRRQPDTLVPPAPGATPDEGSVWL